MKLYVIVTILLILVNNLAIGGRIERKVIEEKNDRYRYSIDIEYPFLKSNNQFNTLVNRQVDKAKSTFIKQVKSNQSLPAKIPGENNLLLEFKTELQQGGTISVLLSKMVFMRGMAHPNTIHFSINLLKGNPIDLQDLFSPQSNYLDTISDYCIKTLMDKKISDEKWIKEGAGASKENYKVWLLSKKGIVILFDAYQVAPYVYGPQKILIPIDLVKGMLKPNKSISLLWDIK